jgi:lipopolysaccharide export system protein LptC
MMSTSPNSQIAGHDAARRNRLEVRDSSKIKVDSSYSRYVGMMKMLLPMLAIALAVVIFSWPDEFDDAQRLDITFVEPKGKEAEQLTMVNPRYLGTDTDKRPFVVTADVAEQDPNDQRRVTLTAVQADMSTEDGAWFSVTAKRGVYHQGDNSLYLVGPIDMYSDSGYEFHSGSANVDLKAGTAETVDKVVGHGPFGSIKADRLLVSDRGNTLNFSGHVELVITPAKGG